MTCFSLFQHVSTRSAQLHVGAELHQNSHHLRVTPGSRKVPRLQTRGWSAGLEQRHVSAVRQVHSSTTTTTTTGGNHGERGGGARAPGFEGKWNEMKLEWLQWMEAKYPKFMSGCMGVVPTLRVALSLSALASSKRRTTSAEPFRAAKCKGVIAWFALPLSFLGRQCAHCESLCTQTKAVDWHHCLTRWIYVLVLFPYFFALLSPKTSPKRSTMTWTHISGTQSMFKCNSATVCFCFSQAPCYILKVLISPHSSLLLEQILLGSYRQHSFSAPNSNKSLAISREPFSATLDRGRSPGTTKPPVILYIILYQ